MGASDPKYKKMQDALEPAAIFDSRSYDIPGAPIQVFHEVFENPLADLHGAWLHARVHGESTDSFV